MQCFKTRSLLLRVLLSVAALLLVSCGGGGAGTDASLSAGTGTVAVALTDGPAEDFDEINLSVVKIELFSESGQVTIFEGSETLNLLDLADQARLFAIRNGVPAGSYSKIRLTLTEIELVKRDAERNIAERAYPKLPGKGKLDLVPRGDFTVHPGETLVLQIDMDANKSIHVVGTGKGKYQFRPVVFVDVMSEALFGKLVRVHGVVEGIDDSDQEFRLCQTDIPVRVQDDQQDHESPGCIQVDAVDTTSIFDAEGRAAGFAGLVAGDEATVYGNFRSDARDDDDDRDDRANDRYQRELDDLELVALVVELGPEGTFRQSQGVAQSAVDAATDRFTLDTRFALNEVIEPAPGTVWNFDTDAQNWLISGELTHNAVGTLTVTQDVANVEYYSPVLDNLQAEFDGGLYRYVQVRLRKLAGTITSWEGFMYWTTAAHSWSDAYRNDVAMPAALEAGEWVTLTWDMHNPTFGADDWKNNTIKQIRFDLSSDIGPVFEIDWVVIGRRASEVVVQLQQGTKIINRFGETLGAGDIDFGVPLMADGVLDMNVNPEVLYAALIVINGDAARTSKLSGTVGIIPDGSCGLSLMTSGGDRSVSYDPYTRAYVVSDNGSQQVAVAALTDGLLADVYGAEAIDGCFDAETIIAFQ